MLNFVGLLYSNANTDTVHTGLDKNLLIFVSRNCQRIEKYFWGGGSFDLGYVMSLGGLGSKVGDSKGGGQRRSHTLKIGTQGLRLKKSISFNSKIMGCQDTP